MTGQKNPLALFDMQRDVDKRLWVAGVALADLREIDQDANTASTNSAATKGRRSSMPSPTPI